MVRQKMLHLREGWRLGGSRYALVLSLSVFLEYATDSDGMSRNFSELCLLL